MESKSPTIRDVARAAGVSIAAVSRTLNAGTGPVSADTRAKVDRAISELRYVPRRDARDLRGTTTSTLGLVLADVTNPFFARLADEVVWEGRARGLQVILMTTREDPGLEAECIAVLQERRVAGVIATPTADNTDAWVGLRGRGVPLVFVDRMVAGVKDASVVSVDNERAAAEAAGHLLDLGHSRIGFLTGPSSASTTQGRVAGYRAAYAARAQGVDPRLIVSAPFRGRGGADAVAGLLALPQPPTALVVANTAQVLPVLEHLTTARVRIPEDLSVVVFDDNPWLHLYRPAITGVEVRVSLLAAHSVERAVSDRSETDPVLVQADLVVRSSTAPRDHRHGADPGSRAV